jgi:hypothetical protein
MAVTLEMAIAAARQRCPEDQWLQMTPSEQTQLIYTEMRRLDLDDPSREPADPWRDKPMIFDGPESDSAIPDVLSAFQCTASVKTRTSGRCAWKPTVMRNGMPYCGFHARHEDILMERRSANLVAE